MRVRQIDIARVAGVSRQAVSAVLARSKGTVAVNENTRKRILEISRNMGYRPHAGARALVQGRFNRIAIMAVQYGQRGQSRTPNNGYMDSAADYLAEQGYCLVYEPLYLNTETDDFITPPSLFSEVSVDGVLALETTGVVPKAVDHEISKISAPVVWLSRDMAGDGDSFMFDEYAHGQMLARHLVELGHSQIGYLGWKSPHYSARQREAGVRSVLAEAGLKDDWVISNEIDCRPLNLEQMADALLDMATFPIGVICYNRVMFNALLLTLAQRGLRVPRDISLCYFASPWENAFVTRQITTLEIPEAEMAQAATRCLLSRINNEGTIAPAKPLLGSLKVGCTTAPPGQNSSY